MPVPLWRMIFVELVLLLAVYLATLMEATAELLTDSRLERLSGEGDERAAQIRALLPHCVGLTSALQTVRTLIVLLMGALAVSAFVDPLQNLLLSVGNVSLPMIPVRVFCLIVVMLAIGLPIQLFGLELPRRVANIDSDRRVCSLFGIINFIRRLFRPFTALERCLLGLLMKLFRIDPEQADGSVTEDEILAMVDIGEEKGAIESNEKELIENIFEFADLTAEDCMIHRTDMTAIDVTTSEEEMVNIIRETGFSRFPVYDNDIDTIVGTLSTRSFLLNARLPEKQRKPLRELLRPAFFVPESMRTDVLFREMQNRKSHMAIVVDEYGGTSGLVTLEDLLEEIVGNIYDEFDQQTGQQIIPQADGSWRAAGSAELDALCEAMGIDEIDTDEYDTLGGLIFSRLTAIPADGSHPEFDCDGLHIRVDELSEHRVEWATVTRLPQDETESQ